MTPRKTYFIFFLAAIFYCLSCANNPLWSEESVENQATAFRREGFQAQLQGDFLKALSAYQKAVEINPEYAIAYNDLGVIYEKIKLPVEAEKMYKKAIELDPQYSAAFTNLAFLYENKKDYDNAVRMWRKRIELGEPDDKWTLNARWHLENLSKADKDLYKVYEENETLELIQEVKELKSKANDDSQFAAEVYFVRGKEYYQRGEYVRALKELSQATSLDPGNKEIEKLLIQAQKRALITP